jgi:stress response protein YsnF
MKLCYLFKQKNKEGKMAQTVIGFFDDASQAQTAVERLQSKGISSDRIDVSSGSGSGSTSYDATATSGGNVTSEGRTVDEKGRNTNKVTDFFNSLFGSNKDDADRYSRVAERSNAIVTVHASSSDEAETAADVLDDCGAVDVDERSAQYGFTNTQSSGLGTRQNASGDDTISRVEENLEVGKREIEKGSVRVRSRIVERPVEEHIRLREEHVNIERNPVNRPLSESDRTAFQERDIEVRESAEVPVVNKEARVVEEVRVSKDVNERDETIRDTVRNTEIDIDKDDDDESGLNRGSSGTGRSL